MIVAIIIIITKIILIIIMSIEKGNISTAVTHYGQQELGAAKWIEAPPSLCLNSTAFSFHNVLVQIKKIYLSKVLNIVVQVVKHICGNTKNVEGIKATPHPLSEFHHCKLNNLCLFKLPNVFAPFAKYIYSKCKIYL